MIRNLILCLGLASPLLAQQPAPSAITTTALPASAVQSPTTDPVMSELDAQKLKLRMPIGASSTSFDLSDSARRAMINSPSVLQFSDQIQLTRQDSITMRGLMDLPIASLSEVVSKMDFYTQIRLVRFGLLQINNQPQDARLYASKLYILTDEIFPRKALQDSILIEKALTSERSKIQPAPAPPPTVESIKNQPTNSTSTWLLLMLLLLVGGAGAYYWFVIRGSSPKTKSYSIDSNTSDAVEDPTVTIQDSELSVNADDEVGTTNQFNEYSGNIESQHQVEIPEEIPMGPTSKVTSP